MLLFLQIVKDVLAKCKMLVQGVPTHVKNLTRDIGALATRCTQLRVHSIARALDCAHPRARSTLRCARAIYACLGSEILRHRQSFVFFAK